MKTKETTQQKYHRGLVLSGGGARGFSHLGAVKALYEHGYTFDIIIGTSMGAIVGAVLADGYHPDEIFSLLTESRLKSLVKASFSKNSLMSMSGAKDFLKEVLRVKTIEELKIPFIATATNIQNGQAHYFTKGNIIEAVIASASIPIIFPPAIIDKIPYVDGGVLNNLPARYIRDDCREIFGFHVNPKELGLHNNNVSGMAQIAERTFHLAMLGNVIPDKLLCDVFVEHANLCHYAAFDFPKMQEIADIGYNNTKQILQKMELDKHNGENKQPLKITDKLLQLFKS